MEKEIATFSKNRTELVKVRLQDYQDKQYVDIRVFLKPGEGDRGEEEQATGKGLCLHADHLSELRRALDKAMIEVEMGGETEAGPGR